jgi:hypothetical protein
VAGDRLEAMRRWLLYPRTSCGEPIREMGIAVLGSRSRDRSALVAPEGCGGTGRVFRDLSRLPARRSAAQAIPRGAFHHSHRTHLEPESLLSSEGTRTAEHSRGRLLCDRRERWLRASRRGGHCAISGRSRAGVSDPSKPRARPSNVGAERPDHRLAWRNAQDALRNTRAAERCTVFEGSSARWRRSTSRFEVRAWMFASVRQRAVAGPRSR